MSTIASEILSHTAPKRRLSKEQRYVQLVETAWGMIRKEGTEALTLGRLAEEAGVTKPVVYDHFGTRSGLLASLYREYDSRQIALMDKALQASEPTLESRATVISAAYVSCVITQGREIPGIIAALSSSPELESVRRECELIFMNVCRNALAPFAPTISAAGLRAMLGAAEALAGGAVSGELDAEQARDELYEIIVAMVARNKRSS